MTASLRARGLAGRGVLAWFLSLSGLVAVLPSGALRLFAVALPFVALSGVPVGARSARHVSPVRDACFPLLLFCVPAVLAARADWSGARMEGTAWPAFLPLILVTALLIAGLGFGAVRARGAWPHAAAWFVLVLGLPLLSACLALGGPVPGWIARAASWSPLSFVARRVVTAANGSAEWLDWSASALPLGVVALLVVLAHFGGESAGSEREPEL